MGCVWAQADHVIETRKGRLKLDGLTADVQALRDVKHFVKDYKGHLPLALPPTGIAGLAGNPSKALHACRYVAQQSCISTTVSKYSAWLLLLDHERKLFRLLSTTAFVHHWSLAYALIIDEMPTPFLQVKPAQVPLRLLQVALARCACCFKSCCLRRILLQLLHAAHPHQLLFSLHLPGMFNKQADQ